MAGAGVAGSSRASQRARRPAGAAAGDRFGISVAIDGDTAVVGAYGDDDNGLSSGSAYVFVKPGSGWANMTETAKLTASDGAAGDFFGRSGAISGDIVVEIGRAVQQECRDRGSV